MYYKKVIIIVTAIILILLGGGSSINKSIYGSFFYYVLDHEETFLTRGDVLNLDLAPLHEIDVQYGDWLVHPCVRYIPEGINGHKWWMAVTPYPNSDSKYEQPILFCGVGNDVFPPMKWNYVGIIAERHDLGYNADPNIFYADGKLWIVWKEHATENTKRNCIMMCSYDGNSFSLPRKVLEERDSIHVGLTAPVILEINDSIKLLATDFEHARIEDQQPFGDNSLAVWYLEGNDWENGIFKYQCSAKQDYPSGFNYWHSDMVKVNDKLYYSVVTPEQADKILIGESYDGVHYRYLEKPLLSRNGNMLTNLYKASLVSVNDNYYLFYPCLSNYSKYNKKSYIHCKAFKMHTIFSTQ
jgi:hypothetical protein